MSDELLIKEALKLAESYAKLKTESKLSDYIPYPKQAEFLNAKNRTKVLFGGNRTGKSHTVSYEIACHLTGIYPDWWQGIRFTKPVVVWATGEDSKVVRNTIQRKLLGEFRKLGTGWIPRNCIIDDSIIGLNGTPLAVDFLNAKHIPSGGESYLQFKAYKQDIESFMGDSINIGWMDEEPPEDINDEIAMRVLDRDGYLFYSFTPLQGITKLYSKLIEDESVHKTWITWDDVKHLSDEAKESRAAGLSEEMLKARKYGVPTIGRSLIFKFPEEQYTCDSFEIPAYWPRIGGIDIGLNHPTCAVGVAIDRDANTLYAYTEYSKSDKDQGYHARFLRNWQIPFGLSHDAFRRDIQTNRQTADLYTDEGLKVFNAGKEPSARNEMVRKLIAEGRLFIFKDRCPELLKQMRMYRTKDDGVSIYKVDDDMVDAFTHAIYMLDKAEIPGQSKKKIVDVNVVQWEPANKRVGY